MPRPKKKPETEAIDELESQIVEGGPIPPAVVNGEPNPDHYRVRLSRMNQLMLDREQSGKPITNYASWLQGLEREIKLSGLDFRTIKDARSEAQVYEDCLHTMIENSEFLLEASEEELVALEAGFQRCVNLCAGRLQFLGDDEGLGRKPLNEDQLRRIQAVGKAVCSRLDRVWRLRESARNPVPKGVRSEDVAAYEASHSLRFMLYVGRTNEKSIDENGTSVFRIAEHHAKMSCELWRVWYGVRFHEEGYQYGAQNFEGLVVIIHPRAGKTEWGIHVTGLSICLNPELQGLLLHNEKGTASQMLKYLSKMFSLDEPVGRRRNALFPNMHLSGKDNNATMMRLKLNKTIRAPTMSSYGVGSRKQGVNANFLYIDDPVDEKERYQESVRKQTTERINNTWLARRQGDRSFVLWTATMWHEEDATCRMIEQVSKGQSNFNVLILPAGGPNERFRPVWPDSPYSAEFLRQKYQTMGARDYMTIYGCMPHSEQSAIVGRLALYPVTLPGGEPCPVHQRFMQGAVMHLSIDPSASARKHADHTGVVYAAHGRLTWQKGNEVMSVPRLRIVKAVRSRAVAGDTIQSAASFIHDARVDYVHIETVGAFTTMADWMEKDWGIPVIRHHPGIKSKEIRLRECQLLLDNTNRDKGMCPPIEWPGVWESGAVSCPDHPGAALEVKDERAVCSQCAKQVDRLVMDPSMVWIAEEILKFGFVAHEDGLDAVTQLAIYLRPDLGVGEGVASMMMRDTMDKYDSPVAVHVRMLRQSMIRGAESWREDEFVWGVQNRDDREERLMLA